MGCRIVATLLVAHKLEAGPASLLAPIEAKFAKRGLSPHAMAFARWLV